MALRKTKPRHRLKSFLRTRGLTVAGVAREAKMSAPHLFDILAGRTEPKESTIERVRRAISQLLGGDVDVREIFDPGELPQHLTRASNRG
jgi:transcriptional regulator with XRE-family HTH domain